MSLHVHVHVEGRVLFQRDSTQAFLSIPNPAYLVACDVAWADWGRQALAPLVPLGVWDHPQRWFRLASRRRLNSEHVRGPWVGSLSIGSVDRTSLVGAFVYTDRLPSCMSPTQKAGNY